MPVFASLTSIVSSIRQGQFSAETLLTQYLATIAEREPQVHAFVDLQSEQALEYAQFLDKQPLTQRDKVLYGVPIAVKEVIDVASMCCSWGTPIHQGRVPCSDAALVTQLREAGAVIVGTTVSTEYAIANAGPTRNPHDLQRTPGGSSSGSAAAVAAQMVPIAIGSQAIGSVIRPAVYCGVYGLKPTRGAISRVGSMLLSPALDHIGIFASQPEAIKLACQALFAFDSSDPNSQAISPPTLNNPVLPTRVLHITNVLNERIEQPSQFALYRAITTLREQDISVETCELPADFEHHFDCIHTLLCHDMALAHIEDRRRAGNHMSQRVRDLIDHGLTISQAQYDSALQQAASYREQINELLDEQTVILAAATDSTAPLWAAEHTGMPFLQGLWTLTGLPTLAVPCGRINGLPIGVQFVGQAGAETLLLNSARLLADNL